MKNLLEIDIKITTFRKQETKTHLMLGVNLFYFFVWLLLNKDKAIDLLKPHESGSIIDIFRSKITFDT